MLLISGSSWYDCTGSVDTGLIMSLPPIVASAIGTYFAMEFRRHGNLLKNQIRLAKDRLEEICSETEITRVR